MALELARALAATERDDNLHIARLLLLLAARAGEKRHSIEGLTKLAKLDFLLRYPNCLERALTAKSKPTEPAHVQEFERSLNSKGQLESLIHLKMKEYLCIDSALFFEPSHFLWLRLSKHPRPCQTQLRAPDSLRVF